MDRRSFIESCAARMGCLSAAAAGLPGSAWAEDVQPRAYTKALLVDEQRRPFKASSLKPQTNYVFHYPFEATPVFLLDLGKPARPTALSTRSSARYAWPGGVGPGHSIVAFSAICAHRLVYPTREVSFISFRKTRATKGIRDELIHCCSENSQYDPAQGARVLSGPAEQPLCAVLLEHDARADTLVAWGTLGGELFSEFFRKYEMKLSLEMGARAINPVSDQSIVSDLSHFCRNTIQC